MGSQKDPTTKRMKRVYGPRSGSPVEVLERQFPTTNRIETADIFFVNFVEIWMNCDHFEQSKGSNNQPNAAGG